MQPDGRLALHGLCKSFAGRPAVDRLSVRVPRGSFFGVLGPNGAGKTTSLSMAVGLLRPDSGTARIFGLDVWAEPARAKALVGVLPDGPGRRGRDRCRGARGRHPRGGVRVPRRDPHTRSEGTGVAVGVAAAPAAPWQVLVRMKVAALRHSFRDPNRLFWTVTGGLVGLALAGATVRAALGDADLLAVALGLWMLGWIVGPLFAGGGDESLRPEYFTMLPLRRRALSAGLVAAAFVGVAPLVALVASASVVAVGARTSVAAALVGVPAALLLLACLVLASKLAVAVYALLLRVRSGAALAGLVTAFVLAFTAQGWALVAAVAGPDVGGALVAAGRIAPSGWALVAVEAAGRGEWLLPAEALVGLGVLAAALLTAWSALLARRTTADRLGVVPRHALVAQSARGAAVGKELRTWSRDLLVGHRLVFSIGYGLAFCLMPLAVGWAGMAQWAGVVAAVMGGAMWAGAYAVDGTALWLTVMVPGAARIDVRARQSAFLLVYGPPVVLLSAGLTWWSGETAAWPLVAGAVPAVLGGAAGVGVLLGLVMAVPATDAHQRSGSPISTGDSDGESMAQVLAGLVLIVVTAVPAVSAAALLGWWGATVGLVTGVLAWWGFGALAACSRRASCR